MGLNLEKSKSILVSAAEYGHAMSQTELGAMLIDGNGVDSDSSRGDSSTSDLLLILDMRSSSSSSASAP